MPEFTYVALGKDGHKESATIQAPTVAAAGHMLKEQGLLATEIHETKKGGSLNFLKTYSTVSLAEKITFIENLSVMLKAGISVSRSLQIMSKQTKNARFRGILEEIYAQVQGGKGLAESMSKYPSVFSNIFLSMIKVGELSGSLDKSLEYLSTQLQRDATLKSRVKGAMIYPSVIISAMVIIGILMSIFVLPQLTSVFKDFNGQLPFMTRVVMAVADYMSAHGIVVMVGLVVFVVGAVMFLKTPLGKRFSSIFFLHFYIINTIVKKVNLARFARILSSLLKSNINVVEALQVTSDALDNVLYKEIIAKSSQDVKLGKPLSDSLAKDQTLFPVIIVQMLQVGEESGTVETILEQLAGHYEEEVDATLRDLSSIIEPLLLLVIGAVVGFLAMALIAPIYNIGQSIN